MTHSEREALQLALRILKAQVRHLQEAMKNQDAESAWKAMDEIRLCSTGIRK